MNDGCSKAKEKQEYENLGRMLFRWQNCEVTPLELLNAIPQDMWDKDINLKILRVSINNAIEQTDWFSVGKTQ